MGQSNIKELKLAGVVLSIGLLALTFYRVDMGQLITVMSGVKVLLLLLVALINFVVIGLKACRLQVILGRQSPVNLLKLFLITLVGYTANSFLPAKSGELARISILDRKTGIGKAAALGAMTFDRVFELVGLLIVLLALPFLVPTSPWMRTGTLVVLVGFALVLLILFVLARPKNRNLINHLSIPANVKALLGKALVKLREHAGERSHVGTMALLLLISVGGWLIQILMVQWCLEALDLRLPLNQLLIILMAINLGILIPAAPANLGTFEISAVLAMGYLGIGGEVALAFALFYHFVQLVPVTLAGVLVLPLLKLGFLDICRNHSVT